MKQRSKKNIGGVANLIGTDFERYFGVYRVLLALEQFCGGHVTRLALQLEDAHVDDWVEDRAKSRDFFQLRTTKTLSWGPLRSDFQKQLASKVRHKVTSVFLVVTAQGKAEKLRNSKRAPRAVRVICFPNLKVLAHLERGPVRKALECACVASPATPSDIEWIWKDVSLAWEKARKVGKFVEVSRVLRHLGDQEPPMRLPWAPPKRWVAAERLLLAVTGLKIRIDGGHFLYDDGSGTAGRISCRSGGFKKLMKLVVGNSPMTLAKFRKILEQL